MTFSVTCYACDQPATTREHAPPFSFFPKERRANLITVPSCALHNNANSMDVEYARNVITTMLGSNEVGQEHFNDKVVRSFAHSPGLLNATFADIRAVNVKGMTTGAFTVDTQRINTVMKACVRALHFRETGQRGLDWQVILPNLFYGSDVTDEAANSWLQFLSMFRQMSFAVQPTNSPEVFEFAIADIVGGRVYSMRFYKGFLVFAFASA
jgi:hypothetical protein